MRKNKKTESVKGTKAGYDMTTSEDVNGGHGSGTGEGDSGGGLGRRVCVLFSGYMH